MNNLTDYKYFLLVGFQKISLVAINPNNQIFFTKEILTNDFSVNENFKTLENFLNQNIFEIEKSLDKYVKDIYLIIDYDNFFSVDISFKYNFKDIVVEHSQLNSALIDLKNQFKKTIGDHEITHIVINKFIIDGTVYSSLPNGINYKDLALEVRFICLNNKIINNSKKILSKYQIFVKRILCCEYLRKFKNADNQNIFSIANSILNGQNQNENFLLNKSTKNKGFFEKFFSFFN